MEGDAALKPRSRRPHTSPSRLPQATIDVIIGLRESLRSKGLDNGPHTIAWHLRHHHQLEVSVASIGRHLHAAGLIIPTPAKRPKASYMPRPTPTPHPSANTGPHHGLSTPKRPHRTAKKKPEPLKEGSGYADVLRHHMAVAEGFEPSDGFSRHTLSRRAP